YLRVEIAYPDHEYDSTVTHFTDNKASVRFTAPADGKGFTLTIEYVLIEPDVTYTIIPAETPTETPTEATTAPPGYIIVAFGDVDGSGELGILDVIAINKSLLGSLQLNAVSKSAADVDRNGVVDTTDALNILKAVVKLVTLPIQS
ncbi:MAG: dockerin type I repeat-containing protein, partial [Oscillospiraceae bacterium]|nr:dockerin type I repeat-containing protein [Oscillospiraceae bacterium]